MRYKFRGVEFNVKTFTYGRNSTSAEADFLAADSDSQGTKLDNMNFRVEGYIYGRKVEETRIKLEQALQKKQGLLVMHDGRSVQVKIEDGWHITKDEEFDDKYNLDLNFKKIDADSLSLKFIQLKEIDAEKIKADKEEAEKSILEEFDENFTFEGFPNFVKMQSFDSITSIANKVSKLTASNLIGQIMNPITGSLDILMSSAGGIGGALMSYLNFRGQFKSDKDFFDAYIEAAELNSGVTPPDIDDESLQQVYINSKSSQDLVNQSAILNAADEAINHKEYDNSKEIEQTVETLQKTTEKLLFNIDNAELQEKIYNLVNQSICLIRKKNSVKTRQVKYAVSLPACVIAHNLYGSAGNEEQAAQIIRRNRIEHALFCPAGEILEVADV